MFDVFLDLSYKTRESVHNLWQVLWVQWKKVCAVTCTLTSKDNNNIAFTFVIGWYKPFLIENHSRVPVWHKKLFGKLSRNIERAGPCWYMLVANQYGPLDLITEVKFSGIQFLKCLSFTDLDQDSKNKHTEIVNHWHYEHFQWAYLRSVCSFGVAVEVAGKMSLYLVTRQRPYWRKPWRESPSSCFCSQTKHFRHLFSL